MNPELAGVLTLAGLLTLLCIAAGRAAAIADRRDDVIRARSLEAPKAWEQQPHVGPDDGRCHCGQCQHAAATLTAPHLDPNACRCPQCVAVIDILRSIVQPDAWDRGLAELERNA